MERKTTIAHAFGKARGTYRLNGDLQKRVAKELCRKFAPFPAGSWLEIGCGTGFLTEELLSFNPEKLFANDICDQMGTALPQDERIHFLPGDGEKLPLPAVSMIASSFALQWFSEPIETLKKWSGACKKLIIALPIDPSFADWEQVAREEGITLKLNRLLTFEELSVLKARVVIEKIPLHFPSPWSFLVWLKKLGANISLSEERVSPTHLRRLSKRIEPFQTQVTVAFLEVTHV